MKIFLKVSYVETFYEDFIELDQFPVSVGRDPESKIVLMGHDVSRKHAEIFQRDGEVFLRDTNSRTGIWHEGQKLNEIKITEGLQLRMGAAVLQFSFIRFPLEQTISFGHEEHRVHHEPLFQRIEALFTTRFIVVLFLILTAISFFTAPDSYRKNDFNKNLALLILSQAVFAPFVVSLVVVFIRKLNRGDYAWHRSLCMAYLLFIFAKLMELLEGSFCWYFSFSKLWNSPVISILVASALFFWWLVAVGKNASIKSRYLRGLVISTIVYGLLIGFEYLSTGYRSNYEIESCDSLTGWHWGSGEDLSSVQSFLAESAKKLSAE